MERRDRIILQKVLHEIGIAQDMMGRMLVFSQHFFLEQC